MDNMQDDIELDNENNRTLFLKESDPFLPIIPSPGIQEEPLEERLKTAPATPICRATTRPPRPSSTAECLRLIACLREEQASAASWEPRPLFEAAEMD